MNAKRMQQPSFGLRPRQAHKGAAGRVVVIAGSRPYPGAPRLAGVGALAAGAGLVRMLVPRSIRCEVAGEDPALTIGGMRETLDGHLAWTAHGAILESLEGASVAVLGPGLGLDPETRALVLRLLGEVDLPLVVDADGLNSLEEEEIPEAPGPRVWTPHPGEAARLLGCGSKDVQEDRAEAARELHGHLGGVVVLKGAGTLVFDGEQLVSNPTGNPGMATGGMGDVLAGMLAGMLAQGMQPFDAACAAVWIHGEAGDEGSSECGQRALTPIDLLRVLPRIMASHERTEQPRRRPRRRRN